MSSRSIWPIVLLFFISNPIQAQKKHTGNVQSEISLIWGFAWGDFEDNLDRPMPGLLVSFGGFSPTIPLILSTEIGLMNYGFDNHLELRFPGTLPSPVSVVNVETGNTIMMAHLVARIVPYRGAIIPYIDGLVGFKYLSTKINIQSEVIFDDDDLFPGFDEDKLFTSSTFNSFAFSYGVGAGIDIRVFSGRLGLNNPNSTIYMSIGARYLFGEEADYLTENSIIPETDRIRFERVSSKTDMLIPKFGMRIGL